MTSVSPWRQKLLDLADRLPKWSGLAAWWERLPQLPAQAVQWFSLDDRQLQAILAEVRASLPTTEAILLGKPQSGKSSIVRGLTGVSAAIVGAGFRPHTQHTARYAYPSEELPLIWFTDTVGLGDAVQDAGAIVQELLAELPSEAAESPAILLPKSSAPAHPDSIAAPESATPDSPAPDLDPPEIDQTAKSAKTRARILILVVKISDFALDSLNQIAQKIRQQHPEIPCLLAITCLHEAYPPSPSESAAPAVCEHPEYPPQLPSVTRPLEALQTALAGRFDRVVAIDFTLEEDGYQPVFYGQEALREAIAALLPEAEARAMAQWLGDSPTSGLGALYRGAGRRYVLAFATAAAAIAAVPLPFAAMPVLTAVQAALVVSLGKLYGQTLSLSQAGGLVGAIAGGFLAQAIARELVKFVPGLGSAIAASWAFGYTWALGEGACVYFGDLLGGKTPDPDRIQAAMAEAFETAKAHFNDSSKTRPR